MHNKQLKEYVVLDTEASGPSTSRSALAEVQVMLKAQEHEVSHSISQEVCRDYPCGSAMSALSCLCRVLQGKETSMQSKRSKKYFKYAAL